jgi:hypothetical protein
MTAATVSAKLQLFGPCQRLACQRAKCFFGIKPKDDRQLVATEFLHTLGVEFNIGVNPHRLLEAVEQGIRGQLIAALINGREAADPAHLVSAFLQLAQTRFALGKDGAREGHQDHAASWVKRRTRPPGGHPHRQGAIGLGEGKQVCCGGLEHRSAVFDSPADNPRTSTLRTDHQACSGRRACRRFAHPPPTGETLPNHAVSRFTFPGQDRRFLEAGADSRLSGQKSQERHHATTARTDDENDARHQVQF